MSFIKSFFYSFIHSNLLFILFWCGYMRSFIHLVFQAFVSKQSTQRRWWWWWWWGRLFQPPKQRGDLSLEVKGRIINFQQVTWKQQTCEVVLCVSGPTCVSPRCRRCTRSGFWSSAGRGRCCLCVGQTDKYIIFYFSQTDPLFVDFMFRCGASHCSFCVSVSWLYSCLWSDLF